MLARSLVASCAIVLLVLSGGCTAETGRAGFLEPAVTLTLGVADNRGRFSFDLADDFAERAARLTDGEVVVTPVSQPDSTERRYNQRLARSVAEGEYDLALVQAHAWDALGVDSLVALYLPFLVDSDALIDEIATGDLAAVLLDGLPAADVVPLGLLPGGLRHVVGVEGAFTSLDDFDGAGLRVAYSEATWALFEALGSTPDDPNSTDVDNAVRAGEITGTDSMFRLADAFVDAPAVAADITPYAHVFTLVANPDALARLSEGQRAALIAAAAETAQWSADTRPSDADEAAALCERAPGTSVVIAGTDAVAEIEASAAPVARALRSDPVVDELVLRIEALKSSLGEPPAVTACEGPPLARPTQAAVPNTPAVFPDGVYRREVTAESLIAAGIDPSTAADHAAVFTLSFRNGAFEDPTCPGSTYRVEDGRLHVVLGPEGDGCGAAAGELLFSSGWQLDGTSMTFTDVRSGHGFDLLVATLFGSAPWSKID